MSRFAKLEPGCFALIGEVELPSTTEVMALSSAEYAALI